MKNLYLGVLVALLVGGAALEAGTALAGEAGPIVVVSAQFGGARASRPADFTTRLARVCGANASYCQAFCTRAAAGWTTMPGNMFTYHPVCRVTYRCGANETRAVEAVENETFELSCRPRS